MSSMNLILRHTLATKLLKKTAGHVASPLRNIGRVAQNANTKKR